MGLLLTALGLFQIVGMLWAWRQIRNSTGVPIRLLLSFIWPITLIAICYGNAP